MEEEQAWMISRATGEGGTVVKGRDGGPFWAKEGAKKRGNFVTNVGLNILWQDFRATKLCNMPML